MTQIRPIQTDYLSLDDALLRAYQTLPKINRHTRMPLKESSGRRTADTIKAVRSVPPFSNSAVDGYAFRFQDYIQGVTTLQVAYTLTAGETPKSTKSGEAVSIMTGAPLPADLDTVIMKEDVELVSRHIHIPSLNIKQGMNVRLKGEDTEKNHTLIEAGSLLTPPHIGLLASQGFHTINVDAPLRIGIASTGNEIMDHSPKYTKDAKITDSNRPMLYSALSSLHHEIVDLGILPDEPKHIQSVLETSDLDVILTSGGMSVGIADDVMTVAKNMGEVIFHGVRIKPGRPVGCALLDDKVLIGLPGNPVAAYTCLLFVVLPILRHLQSVPNVSRETFYSSGFSYQKRLGFREFVRVVCTESEKGEPILLPCGKKGAAMLSSLSQAHGFAIMSETTQHLHIGDSLSFISLSSALS